YACDLAALRLRVDALDRRCGPRLLVAEPVHADHDLVSRVDRPLHAVRRLLDRSLLEAGLECAERATHRVDLVEVGLGGRLELVGQRLDEVPATLRFGDPATT